jgi:fatty-acyl-CoA synthase
MDETRPARWQEVFRFADLLLRAAERAPDRDALVFPDVRLSYADLQARALAAARSLAALGIGPGRRVGVLMPNAPDFVAMLFGTSLLGAIMVPINARFAPRELGYVIVNGDLDVVVTSDTGDAGADHVRRLHMAVDGLADLAPGARPRLDAAPALRAVVALGEREIPGMIGRAEFDALGGGEDGPVLDRHARTAVRSVALMMYTSGTTAMPKGCMLSHEALVRTGVVAGRTKFRLTEDDRFWDPLPMFHMSAILPIIGVFDCRAAFLSMRHFEPAAALRMLDGEGATICYATFPAIMQALLDHPEYDAQRVRRIRVVNNVAPSDTLREMQARMPHAVQISAYGCTECGGVTAFNDLDDSPEQRATTCGTPFEGMEVSIRDLETGALAGPDEPGEILVRGYSVFEGYYKDPVRTAEALDHEGWFHTGDVGAVTADGRVRYLGRTKDMLKVGGENVAAIEIESYLGTHPAVSIAAVVGTPHPKYLEVPVAFVELRPGEEATPDELLAFCREGLARFKVPHEIHLVSEWPMSATKIQKFRLQQWLSEGGLSTGRLVENSRTT